MPKHISLKAAAFFLLVFAFRGELFAQDAVLYVRPGTTLTVAGNNLLLHNADLKNDGAFDASAATVWITGTANTATAGETSSVPKPGRAEHPKTIPSPYAINISFGFTPAATYRPVIPGRFSTFELSLSPGHFIGDAF